MSTPEDNIQVEQKSSIKIGMNAKGDPVVDVKVYEGATEEAMTAIRELAVNNFKLTAAAVGR